MRKLLSSPALLLLTVPRLSSFSFIGISPATRRFCATTTTTTTTTAASRRNEQARQSTTTKMSASALPFGIVVQAEIQKDRREDFLKLIETNAVESRKEPGCLRFDVLQAQDDKNKFIFYEVYENTAAMDHHKQQPHYQAWATFKESGGTVSSVSHKMDGLFFAV